MWRCFNAGTGVRVCVHMRVCTHTRTQTHAHTHTHLHAPCIRIRIHEHIYGYIFSHLLQVPIKRTRTHSHSAANANPMSLLCLHTAAHTNTSAYYSHENIVEPVPPPSPPSTREKQIAMLLPICGGAEESNEPVAEGQSRSEREG